MSGRVDDLVADNERLRSALIQCGRAAGAGLADTVSADFLMLVPGEVEAKIERLRARVAELEATVNEWAGV